MMKKTISRGLFGLATSQLILAANPIYADEACCDAPCYQLSVLPGDPIDPCCINAGYPLPASIDLCCGWDIYARADFLYLAASIDVIDPIVQQFTFVDGINFQIDRTTKDFHQNSKYKPGFRVSLGMDLDSVIFDATYYRYHTHTTSHFNANNNQGISIFPVAGSVLDSSLTTGQPTLFSRVNSKRTINIDSLLISLQRPVYMGKRIIMNLNYGLLGFWLAQKWDFTTLALPAPPVVFPPILTSNGFSRSDDRSWAIGPNLGFKAIGYLPCHFQALFSLDLSVQYAYQYKGRLINSFPQVPQVTNNTTIKRGKGPYVQAIQHAEIGLGWGDYLWCDKYHLDLYVTYSMFSHYLFNYGIPYSPITVDANFLSFAVHGIAIGGRIDF